MNIAIVGAGKLGVKIIESLNGSGVNIIIFDTSEDVIRRLSSQYDVLTVVGDAKQASLLAENNIDMCDFLIAATESDEKNILIASMAKSLGTHKVIARVRDPEHMNQFDFIKGTFDIDYIVNPDLSITNEIYKYLVEKYTMTGGIFTTGKVSMVQVDVKRFPRLAGVNICDVSSVLTDMLVVAISRAGKIIIPHGGDVIEENDIVYLLGERTKIQVFHREIYAMDAPATLKKVMILGGGKTGYYLASKLSEFGANVKIIEKDKDRCYYLSSHLENVMVLHGDATDTTLLEEENMDEMNAFVATTGFDEENLLLALVAKQHKVPDVIAKISHPGYTTLIEQMGVDMALNPQDIVVSTILHYIQGSKRVISSMLIQGQAEIMEIIANDDMGLANKPLKELTLPSGVLIAAIHRGGQVIVPGGDDAIVAGDRVTILSLLQDLGELESLFADKKGLF